MESVKIWVLLIGGVIVITLLCCLIEHLFRKIRHKRRVSTLDNYDRNLSEKEIVFLENAQSQLLNKRDEAKLYPKWYSWFLTLAYVPLMILSFVGFFFIGSKISKYLCQKNFTDSQLLYDNSSLFGVSSIIFIFALIILPGCFLYAVSRRSKELSNYIALSSDIFGFDSDAVFVRQMNLLNHRVRAKTVNTEKPLDVETFLDGRNESYQKGCGRWFLALTAVSLIFALFDFHDFRKVYTDRVVSSGDYFNLFDDTEYTLDEIDMVQLNCTFYRGNPRADYELYINQKSLVNIGVSSDNITGLTKLNKILRNNNKTVFRPHTKLKNGKVTKTYYSPKCRRALSKDLRSQGIELGDLLTPTDSQQAS